MEKMKTSPQMNRYANMSTRTINKTQSISASTEANEKALEKTRAIYQGKEIKKNSLLSVLMAIRCLLGGFLKKCRYSEIDN